MKRVVTKRLWQLHSWLGLIAGIGLLVIGLSGSLLVFRDNLELLFNPDYARVTTPGERQPLDSLIAKVRQTLPECEVTGWLIPKDDSLADLAYVTRRGEIEPRIAFVNPRAGEVRGGSQLWNKTLTGWLLELHYSFFADDIGLAIAGLLAVLLCLLGLSGLWLYRSFWKNFLRLRWRAGARVFFSSLHKSVGITFVAFNLILGFTGAYWNLTSIIGKLAYGEPVDTKVTSRYYGDAISFDKLLAQTPEKIPGFHAGYVAIPSEPKADIVFYGTVSKNPFRSDYGSSVTFDAQTGVFKSATDIRQAGWWTQTADAFYPLHFGTFGGLPIKILWCLGGLTPGILGVSGFIIWWKRRQTDKARPHSYNTH